MNYLRDIWVIALLSCIFTWVIFLVDVFFFSIHIDEEQYIEPTLPEDFLDISHPHPVLESWKQHETTSVSGATLTWVSVSEELLQEFREKALEQKSKDRFSFSYIPTSFLWQVPGYESHAHSFMKSDSINGKIDDLEIELYEALIDVRGKMKNRTIKMFGVEDIEENEFLSVFVHEFAHYLDIYFFSQGSFGDTSRKFYEISWDSTTIIQPWQEKTDFVSGYSLTNKYEDFAESLTYYIFHNDDFSQKASQSETLQRKYDFFWKYLFFDGQFIGTDFSPNQRIKSYYWDITKIPTNLQIFLQYIKNTI